jgi:hypothetical protein
LIEFGHRSDARRAYAGDGLRATLAEMAPMGAGLPGLHVWPRALLFLASSNGASSLARRHSPPLTDCARLALAARASAGDRHE